LTEAGRGSRSTYSKQTQTPDGWREVVALVRLPATWCSGEERTLPAGFSLERRWWWRLGRGRVEKGRGRGE